MGLGSQGHTGPDRDLRRIDRERKCRADRVIGFLLQRIDDQWTSCSRVEVHVVHLDQAGVPVPDSYVRPGPLPSN